MLPHRRVYDEEHNQFRETVRRFAAAKIAPDFQRWEEAGIIDRSLWAAGGAAGLLCPQVPEEFGGAGGDFRHNAVVIEELSYSGFAGPATDFSVHNDVCCGYLLSYGTPEQKKKWLPRMVSGETVCAIAMTEPGTGSDLQGIRTRAVREGDEYRDIGPENLHLQRADVRSRHRRGQDHAGGRLARHEPHSGRDRQARLSPRPKPREARTSVVRYVRIVLR